MKKLFVYIIIIVPIIFLWLHWGGIKSDGSTFTLLSAAVLFCTIATDKMSAKDKEEKK